MQAFSREIELKLVFDPADAGRLKRHLGRTFGRQARPRQTLVSVYFDTPDLRLHEAGISLRVRRIGRGMVQTIKSVNGAAAGLFDRGEWEQPINRAQPDLTAVQDTPLAPLLNGRGPEALRPVFETRVRRAVYQVAAEESVIAIAFDEGDVDTGQDCAPVSELEFELLSGESAELFRLARTLTGVVPLRFAVQSKSDRGYALMEGEPHPVAWASEVHLDPAMSCADAFRVIAHNGLRQLAANEPAVREGRPNALHQMRIGLRRARAAMSLFRDIVGDSEHDRIKAGLKWLAGTLGPARDLDVFMADVLVPLRTEHPDHPGLADICHDIEVRRLRAYADAVAACCSDRYQAVLLDTMEWIESGPWRTGDDPLLRTRREQAITALAGDELARRRRKIIKGGRSLRDCSPEKRHELRIRGKKLRYATEFFADAFPGKRNTRRRNAVLAALKDLQEALGGLNDIATREQLAEKIAAEGRGDEQAARKRAFAAGMIVGRQHARHAELLAAAERAYANIADGKAYWS
ncbi:MAG: CHAD domain-containing protein [Rhizobiales bacterium]|nr:CHAD domain-containing protein [Hyphomicrobiales bacterium]